MKVRCRTNLDLKSEQWPTELPAVPQIGHLIQSKTKHGHFQLQLQVCRVTWQFQNVTNEWIPEIELYFSDFHRSLPAPIDKPDTETGSLWAFYDWYAKATGTSRSYYI